MDTDYHQKTQTKRKNQVEIQMFAANANIIQMGQSTREWIYSVTDSRLLGSATTTVKSHNGRLERWTAQKSNKALDCTRPATNQRITPVHPHIPNYHIHSRTETSYIQHKTKGYITKQASIHLYQVLWSPKTYFATTTNLRSARRSNTVSSFSVAALALRSTRRHCSEER